MRTIARKFYRQLLHVSPALFFNISYKRAANNMGNMAQERETMFKDFLGFCRDKPCMQVGVKDSFGKRFGENWVSVDKFDTRNFIDFQYDIHDLQFEDNSFAGIACISILEHVAYPTQAISEMYRVLKPGGRIWVQLPFQYPYHESPRDYWRVSPDGLRVWMADFEEISCGSYLWTRSSLVTSTYFYGSKQPLSEAAT